MVSRSMARGTEPERAFMQNRLWLGASALVLSMSGLSCGDSNGGSTQKDAGSDAGPTVTAVILGPAAVTASALDQANAAPMHHAVRADQTQAYISTDTSRRRTAA